MTKPNFTSINVIIDASGSMRDLASDTIGSFNQFLTEQREVPGEAALTLYTFSTDYRLVHNFEKLANVVDLSSKSYSTGGGTALLDAMATCIDSVGQKLAAMPEEERPSKIIFLIITDGEENSSVRYAGQEGREKVRAMVEHQREKYSWEFVFMGANMDSIQAGTSLGISSSNSANYVPTAAGTAGLYKSVSSGLRSYRIGESSQVDFFNQSTDNKK
jgi:Mg-chelatase subunit ChlD